MDADPGDQATLRYEWDFNGDGVVDSTAPVVTHTYAAGVYTARLTVRDSFGVTGAETVLIQSGNGAPTAYIDSPAATYKWRVGDTITVTGHAADPQQGTIPAASLNWRVNMHHCVTPGNCHVHPMQEFTGAGGSFVAPDHDYPSYLELVLTAVDNQNLRHSVSYNLDPRTVNLTFTSNPAGLQVAVGSTAQATPFTRTVIEGSTTSVSAVTPQVFADNPYVYLRWNDRATQTRQLTATASTAYSVTFARPCVARPPAPIRC
jgi:PKD repeat protein